MNKKNAFTLAEVVITLIVIGIVSAVTIPMLHNDVNDKKWNVARQKAQATIGEAFKLATVSGYVTPDYDNTKDFVTKVLTKYLKINKQCDSATACGFSSSVKRADGKSQIAIPANWTNSTDAFVLRGANGSGFVTDAFTTKYGTKFDSAAYFQTLDGFSVALYYNPYCAAAENDKYWGSETNNNIVSYKHYSMDIACFNAVYDMNGKKRPNRVGQDVGLVGSFYNGYSVKSVSVLPHSKYLTANNSLPNSSGSNYWLRAQQYCKALHNDDWKVPDREELSLFFINKNIINADNFAFWSSASVAGSSNTSWGVDFYSFSYGGGGGYGRQVPYTHSNGTAWVQCIRTNTLK